MPKKTLTPQKTLQTLIDELNKLQNQVMFCKLNIINSAYKFGQLTTKEADAEIERIFKCQ